MLIDIDKVKVGDRIRKDFGDLQELADDIKQNGLINPPIVTPDTYELLAGERRLRAMKLLGYKQVEVRPMSPRDAEHALNLEISENESRKDFSKSERIEYARRLERIEAAKAKERQEAMLKKGTQSPDKENFPGREQQGQVRDIVAEKLSIGSGKQYEKEKYIVDNKEKLSIEDFSEWDEGKLSTNKAYQKIKQENARLKEQLSQSKSVEVKVVDNTDYEKVAELEKKVEEYKKDCRNMERQYQSKAYELQEAQSKIKQIEEQSPEEQYKKKVVESCLLFNARVNEFIKDVGGYIWLASEINKMPEVERQGYLLSVQKIKDWADALEYNIEKTKGDKLV